jgi:hypothetical protein
MNIDLTLRCPTCGRRADVCFDHGDHWKKRHLRLTKGAPVDDLVETSTGRGSHQPELVQPAPDLLQTVVDEILTTDPWRPPCPPKK